MKTLTTDVLVLGSGFGAAPAALRFAKAGLRVIVVEKGPRIDPLRDFRQTQDPKYITKYLKGLSGDHFGMTYAEGLGGGSGFYEMVSLRAPSMAFEQEDGSGRRLWPVGIDRPLLDPYYDRAEDMLRVEQIRPEEIPKSGLVFSRMMKNLGYSCERARYAVQGCIGSARCVTGCIYGAKQSLLLNYLPQAETAGATIHTDTEALVVEFHRVQHGRGALTDVPLLYDVTCRSAAQELVRYRAKIVILAGGTVGTAKLLLASRHRLGALSRHVGNNIAFNGGVKAACLLGSHLPDGDMFTGRSHPGMISYQFLRSHGITIAAGKPLPLQAVASARLQLEQDDPYWGPPHVQLMKQYRHRVMVLAAFGLTAPGGYIRQQKEGRFEVGLDITDDMRTYYDRTRGLLHDIMQRNGCTPLDVRFVNQQGLPHDDINFSTTHQVGSCRMADSKWQGVCSADGEVFGYPGLFVTDGAAIPTSLAVNTSLTILANAERIVDGILVRLRDLRLPAISTEGRR